MAQHTTSFTAAQTFGFEDAVSGTDRQGSLYFPMGSQKYQEYNAGYDAGLQQRQRQQALQTLAQNAQPNRAGKAVQLVASGAVQATGNGYTVQSQSNGHAYHVTLTSCDCPDHQYRGNTCKHQLAVRMVAKMQPHDEFGALLADVRSKPQPVYLTDEQLAEADREQMYTSWQS